MGWKADTQTASVFATLFINAAVGGAFLILFECLRSNEDIFAPRKHWITGNKQKFFPEKGFLAWIPQVMNIDDETILANAGINLYSMAHLKQQSLQLWASLGATYLFTGICLYHMHKEYEHFAEKRKHFFKHAQGQKAANSTSTARSLTNSTASVPSPPPSVAVVDPNLQVKYTVRVENIPELYRTNNGLLRLFDSIFPGECVCAYVCVRNPELDDAIAARVTARNNLENAIAALHASKDGETRPTLWLVQGIPVMCYGDTKVDAIEYWHAQLVELNEKVALLQEHTLRASNGNTTQATSNMMLMDALNKVKVGFKSLSGKGAASSAANNETTEANETNLTQPIANTTAENNGNSDNTECLFAQDRISGTGFVTFKSRRTTVIATQVPILSEQHPEMCVFPATTQSDTLWCNITTPIAHTIYIQLFTTTALTWGFLFWGAILAFIAALSSLSNLEEVIPALNDLSDGVKAVISGQLPVIVLIVFVSLLPLIIGYILTVIEKRKSVSEVQEGVFRWYFLYQVANVLIIILSGSIFTTISDIVNDPASIVATLGASLPNVSVFFINFLITQWLSGVPTILFRYIPYLLFKLYVWCFPAKCLTRRTMVEGPLAKVTIDYGETLPPLLYVVYLMQIYWVITPIVLALATAFFFSTYVAFKYVYLFVAVTDNDGGGKFFYGLYDYTMIGLMIGVLTMIGFMSLKEGIEQAPLLLPLIGIIIGCWRYTESKYKDLSMHLPYSAAVDVDVLGPIVRSLKSTRSLKGSSFSTQASSNAIATPAVVHNPILTQPGALAQESIQSGLKRVDSINSSSAEGGGVPSAASVDRELGVHQAFTTQFNYQANVVEDATIYPYPYRIRELPLIAKATGLLNPIYYDEHEGDKEIEVKYIHKSAREELGGFEGVDELERGHGLARGSGNGNKGGTGTGKGKGAGGLASMTISRRRGDSLEDSGNHNSSQGDEKTLLTANRLAAQNALNSQFAGGAGAGAGAGGGGPPLPEARPRSALNNSRDNRESTGSQYSDTVEPW